MNSITIHLKDKDGKEIHSYPAPETPRIGEEVYLQYHSYKVISVKRWHTLVADILVHHSEVILNYKTKQ